MFYRLWVKDLNGNEETEDCGTVEEARKLLRIYGAGTRYWIEEHSEENGVRQVDAYNRKGNHANEDGEAEKASQGEAHGEDDSGIHAQGGGGCREGKREDEHQFIHSGSGAAKGSAGSMRTSTIGSNVTEIHRHCVEALSLVNDLSAKRHDDSMPKAEYAFNNMVTITQEAKSAEEATRKGLDYIAAIMRRAGYNEMMCVFEDIADTVVPVKVG